MYERIGESWGLLHRAWSMGAGTLGMVPGNGRHVQELWRGQPYLEAVLEFPADEVECHRVDAGVEGGHVDPEVIHHQEETEAGGERRGWACWKLTERRTEGEFPNCLAWNLLPRRGSD